MDVFNKIEEDNDSLKKSVAVFLENFTKPAFGILTKKEIEFLIFKLMNDIGVISKSSSLYDIMTALRITKSKASQLTFDYDIRKSEEQKVMDEEVQAILCNATFIKDGDFLVLYIERPLLRAYLKEKVRKLGHITDGSFSQALIRINLDVITEVILSIISKEKQDEIQKKLNEAGAKDNSIKSVLKSSLKKLGSKALGEVGSDIVVNKVSAMLSSLFTSNISKDNWEEILKDDEA